MTQGKPPRDDDTRDDDILDPLIVDELLRQQTPVTPPAGLRAEVLMRIRNASPAAEFVTLRVDAGWKPLMPAVQAKLLTYDTRTQTKSFLLRAEAGVSMPGHGHHGYEACLVLEGDIVLGDLVLVAGDFHGAGPGSTHPSVSTRRGVLVYLHTSLVDYPEIHP